ncbi:MAG TPA: TorF family putative porin [Novosphingobium sp.]|nr:TorF family putative porin [Novosphingobium sp.]
MLTSVRGIFAATLFAGAALAATPAFADEADAPADITVTGNVSLVSDYRFRGVSQSNGDLALQGGITVTHASGFYAGGWSSSISDEQFGIGDQELDLFGGWSGEVTSGLTLDAGLLYYVYPGAPKGVNSDFFEPYASVSGQVGPAKLKVGVAYAWDQAALADQDNLYVYSNLDIAVPNTPVTLSGHVGYTDGFLAISADGNTFDWSVGASATVFGPLSVGVSYIGVGGPSIDKRTDDAVVGTLTASF